MRRTLNAADLSTGDIEPAFALIQAVHPSLTLETWQAFATELVDREPSAQQGLIGVRNETGYICGLFVYRAEADLMHERAFAVDVIAAIDIVDASVVIREMMKAARATARRLGCGMIRVRVDRNQPALAHFLAESGLEIEGQVLCTPRVESSKSS